MSIPKINNSFSFSNKSQNTLRNFKGTENPEEKELAVSELSDDDMHFLASQGPNQKYSKSFKTAALIFASLPFVDATASGILKKGSLSKKLAKSAKTLGLWGGIFAAGTAVFGIKRIVNNNSKTLDKINNNNPLLSYGLDLAALYTTFAGLLKAGRLVKTYIKNKFPKYTKKMQKHIAEPIKNILNKSFINKKLVMPAEMFMSKRPYHSAVNKFAGSLLVPAIAVSALWRLNKESIHRAESVDNNYHFLKNMNAITESINSEEAT